MEMAWDLAREEGRTRVKKTRLVDLSGTKKLRDIFCLVLTVMTMLYA